jgi:hypothetical protein
VRYLLPLLALSFIGLALYGEFAFFHDFAWEDDTSWFFFLFSGVAACLLCKANFKVNLVATLFSFFCILSALWVLFSSLLVEIYYFDTGRITEFKVLCALIGHFSLLLTKPIPLAFLVGVCVCLRYKFLPVLCIPFLISGCLVDWLDGWDYRTFVLSSSSIVVLCSFATILDEWGVKKSKRATREKVRPADQSSPSLSGSSLQRSKDQTASVNDLPDDFSPPPCI